MAVPLGAEVVMPELEHARGRLAVAQEWVRLCAEEDRPDAEVLDAEREVSEASVALRQAEHRAWLASCGGDE